VVRALELEDPRTRLAEDYVRQASAVRSNDVICARHCVDLKCKILSGEGNNLKSSLFQVAFDTFFIDQSPILRVRSAYVNAAGVRTGALIALLQRAECFDCDWVNIQPFRTSLMWEQKLPHFHRSVSRDPNHFQPERFSYHFSTGCMIGRCKCRQ